MKATMQKRVYSVASMVQEGSNDLIQFIAFL